MEISHILFNFNMKKALVHGNTQWVHKRKGGPEVLPSGPCVLLLALPGVVVHSRHDHGL